MLVSVEIVADRAHIVLLDDLDHHRTVGLGDLFKNLILCAVALKLILVVLDLKFYLFHSPIVLNIFFQHEVKSLTDTGCFYSFHNTVSSLIKINML